MHKNDNEGQVQLREVALADIGELAGPVVHEVNNLLNTLALHLAIWQQSSPDGLDCDLQSIRQEIAHVVQVLNHFQRRRLPVGVEPVLLDLNDVIVHTVNLMRNSYPDVPISLELDPSQLWILGHEADLRRLCRYLLGNAVRALSPLLPAVVVRSRIVVHQIIMEVEDAGPSIPIDSLKSLFEPGNEQRTGMCCLELAACMSIAQRLRGRVEALARPSGGMIISVRIPTADEKDTKGLRRSVRTCVSPNE